MPNRELKKVRRKKVKSGHYIYCGFHIKKTLWKPKKKINPMTRLHLRDTLEENTKKEKVFKCWVIHKYVPKRWQRLRYRTLERAISVIESERQKLWDEVCKIEESKAKGSSA